MPSIPQSLLWISLVVLWLFVLVPMLISKRDAVRRTSDVALATRVLTSGRGERLRRNGPAAGHRSDPDWQPTDEDHDLDEDLDDVDEEDDTAPVAQRSGRSMVMAAAVDDAEPDYLDVDIVEEDAEALPAAETDELAMDDAEAAEEAEHHPEALEAEDGDEADEAGAYEDEYEDVGDDEYEYVDDSSEFEAEAPSDARAERPAPAGTTRRQHYESKTAAAVTARKYRFRKRTLLCMALMLAVSGVLALTVAPSTWWLPAAIGVVAVLYLAYLRRQTRIEEQLRRRRATRMARSRLGVENTNDREFDVVPSRLRRPGSQVLEIDDEDPIFEHLDHAPSAREYAPRPRDYDLPRAAGQ